MGLFWAVFLVLGFCWSFLVVFLGTLVLIKRGSTGRGFFEISILMILKKGGEF